jgi:hypothetical protein
LSANGILFLVASHQPVEAKVVITQVESIFARKVAVPFAFFYDDTDGTVIQYLERRISGIAFVDATFRNPSFAIVLAYVNGYVLAGSLAGWE